MGPDFILELCIFYFLFFLWTPLIYYNSKSECSLDFMLLNLDTKYLTAHTNAPHAHRETNIIPPHQPDCVMEAPYCFQVFLSVIVHFAHKKKLEYRKENQFQTFQFDRFNDCRPPTTHLWVIYFVIFTQRAIVL